jgi:alanine-glyoxylate transaminase/serine-glyoxylate transaminase/serine-pyruvate transaminase
MPQNSSRAVGRHFLQIPGPTPLPDRVLRAMDTPIIDHRGPEFAKLAKRCLDGIKTIFKTTNPVIIYTATGTGAWEAALVNTLSAGDRVLMVETGQFATLWKVMAQKLGLRPEFVPGDWRTGADAAKIEDYLRKDKAHEIKAVCVLHNETATGCLSPIEAIRKAIDAAGHPALLMVDTISSLASTDYRHDEWGVDVTVGGAQKGLMLPPGMSFNAISDKALAAAKSSKLPKSFWAWDEMLTMNKIGFFPYTPATQMLQGLAVSIEMLHEEGLDNVFARHARLAEATRRAVRAWGLEILCRDPKYYSPTVTAVLLPDGHDADAFRNLALDAFNISFGASFGPYAKRYFRIGHLGDVNDGWQVGARPRRHSAQKGWRASGNGLHRRRAFRRRTRGRGVTKLGERHRGDLIFEGRPRRDRAIPAFEIGQRWPLRDQLTITIGDDADWNIAIREIIAGEVARLGQLLVHDGHRRRGLLF